MQAVILVGGEGTRLRPLTYQTPKPMVPLCGVPFLERTLWRLRAAGIDHVILAAGYLPEAITQHLGSGDRLGLKLTYVIEEEPRGTAGAIKNVEAHITGPFFVLNGDVLTGLDLRAMLAFHKSKHALATIHLIRVDDPSPFGAVVHDANGQVARFVEKPPRDQAPSDEINAGTYLLEPSILDAIAPDTSVSIERETFPKVIADGARVFAFTTNDYWLDVGRPDQYLQAHRDVLDGTLILDSSPDPGAHRGTVWRFPSEAVPLGIIPPVFIGLGVTVDPTARVGPYAVIGENTAIEAHAEVRDSVIWDNVVIEEGARLDGVILADDVRVGPRAQIAPGTVVGHGSQIEADSQIAVDSRISRGEPAQT